MVSINIIQSFQNQKYNEIVTRREKFTDNLFPATNESINFKKEEVKPLPRFLQNRVQSKPSSTVEYKWYRISQILRNINLIKYNEKGEENLIDDVVQGALGDCYYLSALSALAEYKNRIINIFHSREINEIGCYRIKCYIHGEEVELVLDDYFPCIGPENAPQLAFSSVEIQDNNIWPLLLEKAWAKVNKNYNNIIDGTAGQAFQFLTPAGIDIHFHSENNLQLYNFIKEADDRKFIICCDISEKPGSGTISNLASMGLVSNHAYSIISVQ
jgi:calpain-15